MSQTPNTQENKAFLHAFNLCGILNKDLQKIRSFYQGDFQSAWRAGQNELTYIIGLEKAKLVTEKRESVVPELESRQLEQKGVKTYGLDDQDYPDLLRQIADPPLLLYLRGSLKVRFGIGVVGSRKMSAYGLQAVNAIVSDFSQLPVDIISGLAYGVDAAAHTNALENGINTIAVLGSGVDDNSLYPRENRSMAEQIISHGGAVLSEFPPGTNALPYHFPMRNRLISGLSKAIIVVEAKKKSGALLTAQYALEQNRDVYAVPGSIFNENSEGTNALIKAGAKPISEGADIINDYPELKSAYEKADPEKLSDHIYKDLTENEKLVLNNLSNEGRSLSMILELTGLHISAVLSAINMLEMKGLTRNLNNGCFARNLTRTKKGR